MVFQPWWRTRGVSEAMAEFEKILYFDCSSGICGDMIVAALVDLGVPAGYLREELARLGLPGWLLRLSPDSRGGLRGTRAEVELTGPFLRRGGAPSSTGSGTPRHAHRAYRDIEALIGASGLAAQNKARALAIFATLAAAEAKVHGTSLEELRFHEVGATDSIVDIVAAGICLEYFKPDRVLSSSVQLGGGFVKCAHGLLPVPVPAVAELLRGVPVRLGASEQESTTPTGAAFLAAFVDEYTDERNFRAKRSGIGIGHREGEIPDLLTVVAGEL